MRGGLGAGEGIDDSFADIIELSKNCRFTDCGHTTEPGCAVRMAIERHELNEEHLKNFLKLKKESDFHDLSYADKRRKDRMFGRYVRSVMKNKGK